MMTGQITTGQKLPLLQEQIKITLAARKAEFWTDET
jgi:hypothetical protein